ncbi:MAG: hypothetical protein LBL47_00010 [Lactobacillus sp.]|jgi:hypothetical protein|nr:hypothetical protein [Lactobacillus sp.]
MSTEIFKWLTMIELPIFAAILKWGLKHRKENEESLSLLKDSLQEFKLHVARNYVSNNYLKDVENRLTSHLLRIEKKLDETYRK